MDGASGQQTTRQKWSDDSVNEDLIEEEVEDIYVEEIEIFGEVLGTEAAAVKNISEKSDKTVFSISFVPLQLKANGDLIWVNETPSSVYYCRPIKFEFTKEETDYVRRQYEYYTEILEKEEHYTFKIEEYNFKIKYDLKCTMIDGKICNMLTNQRSTRSCNICKVGPSNINNLHYIYENCKFEESFYRFGISTLHCWIRCFEYILHLSYNLDIKKGSVTSKEDKQIKEDKKKEVQNLLKKRLSILVDVVKQGFGYYQLLPILVSFLNKFNVH